MSDTQLGRILDDLFSIEVNVVVKDSMTARKMPEPAHALLDIIDEYDVHLLRVSAELSAHWRGEPPVQVRRPSEPGSGSERGGHRRTDAEGLLRDSLAIDPVPDCVRVSTFQLLGERAREAEAVLRYLLTTDVGDELDPAEALILKRIFRNCDQLKAVLLDPSVARILDDQGVGRSEATGLDLRLGPDSLLVLRKVWDLGVETVALQTVAQLDGDVVTRIQRARLNAMSPMLLELHREAVDSSLGHWDRLFEILATLATDAFRTLMRR